MHRIHLVSAALILCFAASLLPAQDAPQAEPKKYMTAQARLLAAKTVYLKNSCAVDIPFNIIEAGFESWPRYLTVNSPDQADLIVEVVAPEEVSSASVSSETSDEPRLGGKKQKSESETKHEVTGLQYIKLAVMDAKTKVTLFSAMERPKNAWKEKTRTDSQIQTTQKLLAAFRNRVEPENAAAETKKE